MFIETMKIDLYDNNWVYQFYLSNSNIVYRILWLPRRKNNTKTSLYISLNKYQMVFVIQIYINWY